MYVPILTHHLPKRGGSFSRVSQRVRGHVEEKCTWFADELADAAIGRPDGDLLCAVLGIAFEREFKYVGLPVALSIGC